MAGNTYVSRLGNIRKNARSSGQTCACKKLRISAALRKRVKSCPVKTINLIVDYRNVVLLFLQNFQCELEYYFFKYNMTCIPGAESFCNPQHLPVLLPFVTLKKSKQTYVHVRENRYIHTYILSNDWHVNIYSHCAHAHYTFKPPLSPHYNWLHCRAYCAHSVRKSYLDTRLAS